VSTPGKQQLFPCNRPVAEAGMSDVSYAFVMFFRGVSICNEVRALLDLTSAVLGSAGVPTLVA
jgi:hypothetical protein